jgi:hypothetical protein
VVLRWGTRRDRVLLLPTFYACVFSLAVNGDWMHSFRFLATTAPFLAVVLARAIALTAARWWPPGLGWRAAWEVLPARRRLLAGAGAVAGALFIVQLAWTNIATVTHETFKHLWKPPLWPVHVPGNVRRGFDTKLAGVTRWALEHVGPGQRVATGDVGFPTWAVNEEIVDILGLTDPVLCRVVPGQDAAAYRAYVGGLEPEYVVVRYHRDQPASRYDRLTLASGLLDDYEEAATVGTYGEGTRAVVYRRRGGVRSPTPGEVLARFDRAVRWNPRVGEVRAWREAYRQAHATAAAR